MPYKVDLISDVQQVRLLNLMPKGFDLYSLKLHHAVIAGGAIRDVITGNVPHDIDIFFLGADDSSLNDFLFNALFPFYEHHEIMIKVEEQLHRWDRLDESGEIHSRFLEIKCHNPDVCYQLMWFNDKDIESLLDGFDFTITQFAFDGNSIYYTDQAISDSTFKRLQLHSIKLLKNPIGALHRYFKFIKRGYTHDFNDINELLGEIRKMDQKLYESELERVTYSLRRHR